MGYNVHKYIDDIEVSEESVPASVYVRDDKRIGISALEVNADLNIKVTGWNIRNFQSLITLPEHMTPDETYTIARGVTIVVKESAD